ncbi:TPA: hypothetical protein SLN72_000161 [Morganella morganii]|nr:hypothetical protein [Morganella morganii]
MIIPTNRSPDIDYEKLKGGQIGYGCHRSVFEVIDCTDFVLKECKVSGSKMNENEAFVYYTAVINNYTKSLKTIASVYSISKSGKYLIMEKLKTDCIADGTGIYVMKGVSDKLKKNYGIDGNGAIKCLDYAVFDNSPITQSDITDEVQYFKLPPSEVAKSIAKDLQSISRIYAEPE